MKVMIRLTLASMALFASMLVAAPANAGVAMQMWRCEMREGVTEMEVEAISEKWLAAAKKMDGGADLEAYVNFPVAVNATGQIDFLFVVMAPSFAAWGRFWDAYQDSPDAAADAGAEGKIDCPDSALWDSHKVAAE